MSQPRIAFLGLGLMGHGMAHRLLAQGYPVNVYNRSRDKTTSLEAAGATVGATPRAAATDADFIISMVADDAAAQAVWLAVDGALAAAKPGCIAIESSTVTLQWIRALANAAAERKVPLLDAPVTGSRVQAAAGELVFLVGGDAAVLEMARPVLAAMSKSIVHLGPTGSGAQLKLINNFLCSVQVAALAEAVAMIERSSLVCATALDILGSGAPGSPLVKAISARMAAADYTPHFLLRLMAKDLKYALSAAQEQSLDLTTARTALALFNDAIAAGHGDRDISALIELFRQAPGGGPTAT
jgi:3-hydroxyisobutyrate dehydrogenase